MLFTAGSAEGRCLRKQATLTETEVFHHLASRLLRRKTELEVEQEAVGELHNAAP